MGLTLLGELCPMVGIVGINETFKLLSAGNIIMDCFLYTTNSKSFITRVFNINELIGVNIIMSKQVRNIVKNKEYEAWTTYLQRSKKEETIQK